MTKLKCQTFDEPADGFQHSTHIVGALTILMLYFFIVWRALAIATAVISRKRSARYAAPACLISAAMVTR